MLVKNIETADQVPWLAYATYDEEGFVNGVRDDAPEEIKRLYEERKREIQAFTEARKPIAK